MDPQGFSEISLVSPQHFSLSGGPSRYVARSILILEDSSELRPTPA